jgi:hypothetical protein
VKTLLLARTFFARFFESDLLPPGVPQAQFTIWAMAGLAAPGLLLPTVFAQRYLELERHPALLTQALVFHRLLFITLTMIALGFVALIVWESVFPDRRDARVIGVLPLSGSVLVVSRLMALAALACIFLLGTNAVPTLMYGSLIAAYGAASNVLTGAFAHLVATSAAGAFVFFLLIALQGILLNLGSRRFAERLGVVMQVIFVVALLQLVFFFPHVRRLIDGDAGVVVNHPLLRYVPSIWFLALYDVLGGSPAQGTWPAARLALIATGGTVATATGLMVITHARLLRLALESQTLGRAGRWSLPRWRYSVTWLARRPQSRAVRQFTIRTLARSRTHRMLLALYGGVALALVVSGLLPLLFLRGAAGFTEPSLPVLSAPFVLMFLLLVGARACFAIPVEPKANWVIRIGESAQRWAALNGVRDAMVIAVVVPVTAGAALTAALLWGLWPSVVHAVVCLTMGLGLTEVLLIGRRKLPFTCTYFPGLARLRLLWWAYLTAFTTFSYTTPLLETAFMKQPSDLGVFVIVFGSALVGLDLFRRRAAATLDGFTYNEEDPTAMFAGFDLSEGLAANRPAPRLN